MSSKCSVAAMTDQIYRHCFWH